MSSDSYSGFLELNLGWCTRQNFLGSLLYLEEFFEIEQRERLEREGSLKIRARSDERTHIVIP